MLFFQINPTFQRFDCKVFLTDALRYIGGVVERVMIDNTHVVVLRGTGREMIPVPEMEAFGERFGFHFVAHERGDANRSARVERPFSFIENNFLAGRTFASWDDLNNQARQWCDRVNSTYKKHIRAVPRELFAVERMHLKSLPSWIANIARSGAATSAALYVLFICMCLSFGSHLAERQAHHCHVDSTLNLFLFPSIREYMGCSSQASRHPLRNTKKRTLRRDRSR